MVNRLPPRSESFGRKLDYLLDSIYRAILELQEAATMPLGGETAYNNGETAVQKNLLYGLDSEGRIAPSIGGILPVEPIFMALATAGTGQEFPIQRGGRVQFRLESPGSTVTRGSWVWLSTTLAGRVTPTRPVTGSRFRVGHFAGDLVSSESLVSGWLTIFPQSGAAL